MGTGGGFKGTHLGAVWRGCRSTRLPFFCYANDPPPPTDLELKGRPGKSPPGPSPHAFWAVLSPSHRSFTHHPIFTACRGIPLASVGSTAAAGEWIPGPSKISQTHGRFTRRSAERWQDSGAPSLPRAPQLPLEECPFAFPQIG